MNILSWANHTGTTMQGCENCVRVRWMIRRDMPSVVGIEERCFNSPLNEEDIVHLLRQRNNIGMTAEIDDEVIGYMIYELHKDHLHLIRLAVSPDFQKTGVGQHLVEKLKSKIGLQEGEVCVYMPPRRTYVTINLRETNLHAQLFFKKQKFLCVETQRNFFEDTDEDAYVMKLTNCCQK